MPQRHPQARETVCFLRCGGAPRWWQPGYSARGLEKQTARVVGGTSRGGIDEGKPERGRELHVPPRGVKKDSKRGRQYEHVKESEKKQGRSTKRAEEIAARTVNKERARSGES